MGKSWTASNTVMNVQNLLNGAGNNKLLKKDFAPWVRKGSSGDSVRGTSNVWLPSSGNGHCTRRSARVFVDPEQRMS
jgi:hypothetical protein